MKGLAVVVASVLALASGAAHAQHAPATQPTTKPSSVGVVYVVQAGGNMLNDFADVRAVLENAINSLGSGDQFNVIFQQDDRCTALRRELVPASGEWKQRAANCMEDQVTPRGESWLGKAYAEAIRERPDVIWVISTGDLYDSDKLAGKAPEPVKRVCTFAVEPCDVHNENSVKAVQFLWDLAHDNAGVCMSLDGKRIVDRPVYSLAPPKKHSGKITFNGHVVER
jgi:hypothetical protein